MVPSAVGCNLNIARPEASDEDRRKIMGYLYDLPGQVVVDPDTREEWTVDSACDDYVEISRTRKVVNDQVKYWKIKEETSSCECTCCCCRNNKK